ncbi:DUF2249 domain-containing protein [Rhizobium alvei]|uniref:DUF2249 domain-containing protein n=1 Tax=Rhizobium alvei TaxID=1132659 RepID=A0ABT8YTM1_9HYPH|nr:DUF2249 domain-containing protein [Rhizobium alvei]MDO6966885.1 DUF2249 domain-containing protein [Rhizobium alvei]
MLNLEETREVDVRLIPPNQRHPTIFGMLTALAPGAAMHVTSDHDPRPLHYQIETRWPDEFLWVYLANGPEVWKVQIRRADSAGCDCCCGH